MTAKLGPARVALWQAGVLVACGSGLLLVALAYASSRGGGNATPLFWAGLLVMFVPVVARCVAPATSRRERVGLLLVLTFALYLVKVLQDPITPTGHDELVSYRSTMDVMLGGDLFKTNPVVEAYSDYPGLHIITAQLALLSGASVWMSALIVVGVARVLMTAAVFIIVERLGNARYASLGVLVYMANPSYVLFDARFAYESLALPLAVTVIALIVARDGARAGPASRPGRGHLVAALLVAAAVTVTHHASSVFLSGILIGWALLSRRLHDPPQLPRWVWLVPPALTAAYIAAVSGGAVHHELGPVFHRMAQSISDLVTGHSGPKRAFGTPPGQRSVPVPERLVGFGSVLLALGLLGAGVWRVRRTRASIVALLALLAALYPVTLALRLTEAGSETSNRASEFVFLGLALLSGPVLLATTRPLRRIHGPALMPPLVAVYVGLLFVGGMVVGTSWYSRLPGPYMAAADPRSIDAVSRAAARWARDEVPPEQRWAADRENALTLTAFAGQNVMTGEVGAVAVPELFLAAPMGPKLPPAAQAVLDGKGLHYVLTDERFAVALPADGYYFERNEPGSGEHVRPISRAALNKFDHIPAFDRAYDSGPIVVYRSP